MVPNDHLSSTDTCRRLSLAPLPNIDGPRLRIGFEKKSGCGLLGDPLWDTSSSQGRLLATLLAGIADFERELIRERTGAGRRRAMANGVKFGRKRKLSDYQRAEAIQRRGAGDTLAAIAKSYGVSVAMISRL